jgi:putative phosphoesterase
MRIALTSDLHVDSTDANRALIPYLADAIAQHAPDVLVVAGDVSARVERLEEALATLARVTDVRLFVPGNHDIWVARSDQERGATSTDKHDRVLADICDAAGFTHLGREAHVVGDVGFAGTIGWYDYSFQHPRFPFTEEEFSRKAKGRYRWMDLFYAKWVNEDGVTVLSDQDVTARRTEELKAQLTALGSRAGLRHIVVATHHLPYVELLREPQEEKHAYFRAFLGARRLGEAIDACALVGAVLVGHLHRPVDARRPNGARVVSAPVGYLRPPPADLRAVAERSVAIVEV